MTRDAHRWMRRLRFEYWRVAQLRELRVGEQLWVGWFAGPSYGGAGGICEAYFERERGCLSFHATWTINIGTNPRRSHILTGGKFRLLVGNMIEFLSPQDEVGERTFQIVCRYCDFFYRHRRSYGLSNTWRGTIINTDGHTKDGRQGPEAKGLGAVVEVFLSNQPEEQNDVTN